MTERERRLAGVDFKLSYVPLQNNQFRSFTWGTEVLYSDNRYLLDPNTVPFDGDEHEGNVGSIGLYSYVSYKWSRQWSAGFLFDYVQSPQSHSDETYDYSPFVTFALSHWNQLRLQYTHTDHNVVSGLNPTTPSTCNGRGSSARIRTAGNNANRIERRNVYEIEIIYRSGGSAERRKL